MGALCCVRISPRSTTHSRPRGRTAANFPTCALTRPGEYLEEVRARTLEVIDQQGIGDGAIHEMVLRHEQQHGETMLQTIQLAQLDGYRPAAPGRGRRSAASSNSPGSSWSRSRPARARSAPRRTASPTTTSVRCTAPTSGAICIGRTPITNASYLTFVEGGGYERREWWSDEGWAWKEEYDISRPGGWTADRGSQWRLGRLERLDPLQPVVHVSWFEADAFARAHGARLPDRGEWEKAATWDQERQRARRYPWGEEPPVAGVHANVDRAAGGPQPAGAHPEGASPFGCLGMIGDVWEWTSSHFDGYPGFAPYPYKEYSQVFFGDRSPCAPRGLVGHLRPRSISPTFRNWDYPQRRQIFSGFRIANDLP